MTVLSEQIHSYLGAWRRKDLDAIAVHLHDDVRFKGPNASLQGRAAVLAACERMFPMLWGIDVRRIFLEGEEAVCLYDFNCAAPIGTCRTAEYLTFEDGKIRGIELFFDATPFKAPS